jgi:hypothetical protein
MVHVKGETLVEEVDLAYLSICINKIITVNNSYRLVGILVMEIKPSAVGIQYSTIIKLNIQKEIAMIYLT